MRVVFAFVLFAVCQVAIADEVRTDEYSTVIEITCGDPRSLDPNGGDGVVQLGVICGASAGKTYIVTGFNDLYEVDRVRPYANFPNGKRAVCSLVRGSVREGCSILSIDGMRGYTPIVSESDGDWEEITFVFANPRKMFRPLFKNMHRKYKSKSEHESAAMRLSEIVEITSKSGDGYSSGVAFLDGKLFAVVSRNRASCIMLSKDKTHVEIDHDDYEDKPEMLSNRPMYSVSVIGRDRGARSKFRVRSVGDNP